MRFTGLRPILFLLLFALVLNLSATGYAVPPDHGYALQLSEDLFRPNSPVQTTALLTQHGEPVPGASIRVSFPGFSGTFVTDPQGETEISFPAPGRRAVLPLLVQTDSLQAELAMIYIVPEGYGIIEVESVRDRSDLPVRDFSFSVSQFWPKGGWDYVTGSTSSGLAGAVMRPGTHYVELFAPQDDVGLFLFAEVQVVADGRTAVSLTATDTVRLRVLASLEGDQLTGKVSLHNQSMPARTLSSALQMPQDLFVTPGLYTVRFQAEGQETPVILLRPDVPVTMRTAVSFDETMNSLATLSTEGRDGYGNPLPPVSLVFQPPGFQQWEDGDFGPARVTPELPYRANHYAFRMTDADGSDWWYSLFHWGYYWVGDTWVDPPEYTPSAGEQLVIPLGGPVEYRMEPNSGCMAPGCTFRLRTGLLTANGQRMHIDHNGPVTGTLTLTDPTGSQVWSWPINSNDSQQVRIPDDAQGTYTLTATWDLGPYQGVITSTYPFTVD